MYRARVQQSTIENSMTNTITMFTWEFQTIRVLYWKAMQTGIQYGLSFKVDTVEFIIVSDSVVIDIHVNAERIEFLFKTTLHNVSGITGRFFFFLFKFGISFINLFFWAFTRGWKKVECIWEKDPSKNSLPSFWK